MKPCRVKRCRGGLGVLLASALLIACDASRPQLVQQRFYHFGTEVDVSLMARRAQATPALQRIDELLGQWHRRWHAWQPSELTALNDGLQAGRDVAPANDLGELIRRCQQYSARTEGLFNPALGQRIRDWGFARDDMNTTAKAPAPVAAKDLPRMTDLVWEGDRLRSRHPDLRLDLGGIAKGYALNRLRSELRSLGLQNGLINLGGDVLALGKHGTRRWTIAVQDPDGGAPLAALELTDGEQVFTSGVYARAHDSDIGRVHHIIDPRSGAPAEGNLAVTVLGRDGEWLQVASKTLLIVGDDWPRWASKLAFDTVLVVNRKHEVEITMAMAKRLEQAGSLPAHYRVVSLSPVAP